MKIDKLIVFTKSYFDGKIEVDSFQMAKKLINDNPDNYIRVQFNDFRMLLKPSYDGNKTREIEGFSDRGDCYKYFNTNDCLSQIIYPYTYLNRFTNDRWQKFKVSTNK